MAGRAEKASSTLHRAMGAETKDSAAGIPFETVLKKALDQFIVRRKSSKTVIAGYPWFLDWGRDAIIVSRGVIAMGDTDTAAKILTLFGQFEENGTLPNMLQGENAANRDTSDAPLWFAVACRDMIEKEKSDTWLNTSCGSRTIRQILVSIVESYMAGTFNGIGMDPDSGLIYSPSHFTWMDTNHPAGTPRKGYPIEIQALWYATLDFFSRIDTAAKRWAPLRDKVRRSIEKYFLMPSKGYLADCLHADATLSAAKAEQDDALRPNQLFALTLQAVEGKKLGRSILDACQTLLVPGAIRSYAAWRTKGLIDPCPLCMRENLSTTRTHPTGAGIRAMRILPANPRIITVLHGPGPFLPFAKRGTAYTERHPVKRHWPGSAVCGIYWKADASGRFLKFWTVIFPTRNGAVRPRRGGLVKFSGCGSC
ncbi:MAG: amylo-alpha-1,6-glucosidase [Deltaproteobacteria bacterium]